MNAHSIVAMCALVLLTSCYVFDPNLPRPKTEYGKQTGQTITVTAGYGFRKPGLHHVSQDTTLRQFIEIAAVLPNRRWGAVEGFCGCRLRMLKAGKPGGFQSPRKPTEQQLDTRLEDGAIVDVIKWNW